MRFIRLTLQVVFCNYVLTNPLSVTYPNKAPLGVSNLKGKFLHVTDIHLDKNYLSDSSVESYCHRKEPSTSPIKVGRYGALGSGCDSPTDLIQSTFQFIKAKVVDHIDFIIDTGDVVRHDRDNKLPRTTQEVVEAHKKTVEYYSQHVDLNSVRVIPTIGNNDEYLHDIFEKGSSLLPKLAEIWRPYGLDLTNDQDFLNGGYFKVNKLNDQLLIVSLNTLAWYVKNTKSYDCDVSGTSKDQLLWFKDLLTRAKTANQSVYILSHIPPQDQTGQTLYKPKCYNEYLNLLGDFSESIKGHFNGHTNFDSLALLTKSNQSTPKYQLLTLQKQIPKAQVVLNDLVLVLTNSPSVIPTHNPALRTYSYDVQNRGALTEYSQFYANLTQANQNNLLRYQVEYTSKINYGLQDLSLSSWKKFFTRLLDPNTGLYKVYSRLSTVNGLAGK